MDWTVAYLKLHGEDVPGAKYKIGQRVTYQHHELAELSGEGNITGVNCIDDGVYEYMVSGVISVLFYEDELKSVDHLLN